MEFKVPAPGQELDTMISLMIKKAFYEKGIANLRDNKLITIFFVIVSALFFLYFEKEPSIPLKYKKWLEEEVVYVITPKEEKVFRELETDKQRDLFIEEFWRQRDPTPGTPRNEFREEHYRRIDYANRWFGRGTSKPGWKTERGRVYILLGEPISRHEYRDDRIYPLELWFYQGGKELEPFFYILFFQRHGAGDYELYNPLRWTVSVMYSDFA
jgi:GWxTD domain-containing protein